MYTSMGDWRRAAYGLFSLLLAPMVLADNSSQAGDFSQTKSAIQAESTTVAVASNFVSPMKGLIEDFQSDQGHQVRMATGSSGRFYAQITQGAPFDLFFSADQHKIQALVNRHQVLETMTYAIGALVAWAPGLSTTEEVKLSLQRADFSRLAMANPKLAPYGMAAEQVLNYLGITPLLKGKRVLGENIAQAYQYVYTGNGDVGLVALSQVQDPAHVKKGAVWHIPQSLYQPVLQDMALLKRAADNQAARAFWRYMQSERAHKIIRRYGYKVPREQSQRLEK